MPPSSISTTMGENEQQPRRATTERRDSFVQFVMSRETERSNNSTAWARLFHSATLLGYGQLASFVTVVFTAWLSSLVWTEDGGNNSVPRLDNWAVLGGITLPASVFYAASTWFHIYQASAFHKGGPHLAKIPLLLSLVFVPAHYLIQASILWAGVDSKYYGLDLVTWFAFCATFVVFDIGIRNRRAKNGAAQREPEVQSGTAARDEEAQSPALRSQLQNETVASGDERSEHGLTDKRGIIRSLFRLIPLVSQICITFVYPFGVIPLFFSSSVWTRVAICLFLHPVLLEAAEALGRGYDAERATRKLRAGKITLRTAERRITQLSLNSYALKQNMAFSRRFMLLNMGSPDATLIALVATAIEEAFSRGFVVQIDNTLRSIRGQPELVGDNLRLQRLVWMCDTNQSCIAEFNAILTSSFAQVLLQRHAAIFAIGYEVNQELSNATVFVQLLVELILELLVDNTTMQVISSSAFFQIVLISKDEGPFLLYRYIHRWAESEHGIPVVSYFTHANGIAVFGFHIAISMLTLSNALYAFIRHPHFSSCDSNSVCDCLEQSMFREWFGDSCATNNATTTLNSTEETDLTRDLLDDVDFFAVLIALVAGFAALALIVLAVLFARYQKRQKVVMALEADVTCANQATRDAEAKNRQLKFKLQQAQRTVDKAVGESAAQLKQYCIKFSELTLVEEIGHGSFGVVWKGDFRGKPCAIKTVRVTRVNENVVTDFMEEIKLMAPLHHDFLMQLIGGCWEDGPDNLCMVLEYCGCGSLKDLLNDNESGHNWETPYFAITLGVASCFRYLHHEQPSGESLIHRDLKPDNVMICDDLSPRVGDFGESTRFNEAEGLRRQVSNLEDGSALTMTLVGTPLYTAPEILSGFRYNKSVDVYSFAVTLLEIGCCAHNFIRNQFLKVPRHAATHGWRPKPSTELVKNQPELWKLIQACWSQDFMLRPTFIEIAHTIEGLKPTLKLYKSPIKNNLVIASDSADALNESLEEKQKRATARYQSINRAGVDLKLLEAEASRDEMAHRLHKAEMRIIELQQKLQNEKDQTQRTTMDNRGISLRVSFEYHPTKQQSVLGEGSFGTVYSVKSTLDGNLYAMKRLDTLQDDVGDVDSIAMSELLQDLQRLSLVRSEFFVQYVTSSIVEKYLVIVMERLHGVEFRDILVARKAIGAPLHEHLIEGWLKQLAAGISYLHDKAKLIHQDLHNGNVMITWNPNEAAARAELVAEDDELLKSCTHIKILNLGLSSYKSERSTRTAHDHTTRSMSTQRNSRKGSFIEVDSSELCGFKAIRAPEMWTQEIDGIVRFDAKTDVWALALLVCEAVLCSQIEEWYEERETLLSFGKDRGLQQAKIAEVAAMSPRLGNIVSQMLVEEPRLRLSAQEVLHEVTTSLNVETPQNSLRTSSPLVFDESLHALRLLDRFSSILPGERNELQRLCESDIGAELVNEPAHIGGGVGLLRLVRDPDMSAYERARKMLKMRQELGNMAKYEEIRDRGMTLHTLPGSVEMREATWETNEWIGIDSRGNLVVYERWGAISPKLLLERMPLEACLQWDSYRNEAKAMVLDVLSRQARRVIKIAIVLDMVGLRVAHRKIVPHVKVLINNKGVWSVPDLRSSTHVVRVGHIASSIFGALKRASFLTDNLQATTFLISGDDPFASSTEFAARFGRHALPATIGGTLHIGLASFQQRIREDANCCLGVSLPCISDANALWEHYKKAVSRYGRLRRASFPQSPGRPETNR